MVTSNRFPCVDEGGGCTKTENPETITAAVDHE
jgi:hypothetical protein